MASTIFSGQVVSGLTGFVFWALAAHEMPAAQLGISGASAGAMAFIGPLGMLGVGTLVIAELPRQRVGAQRRFIFTGLGVAGAAAGAMGLVFVLLGAPFLDSYEGLLDSPWTPAFFVLGCALTALSNVFDQVMLVVGAPTAQVGRNVVSGVVKLAAFAVLLWLSYPSGVGAALLAWSIGLLAGGALAVLALVRHLPSQDGERPRVRHLLRQYALEAMHHHGVNIALFSGALLQPVIIGAVLPAQANADFTAVRLATLFAFLAPFALAMAFFASSADNPRALVARSRMVTRVSLGLAIFLTAALWIGGDFVLGLFGGHYEEALGALRITSLAVPLLVFKDQYIALARATGRTGSILVAVAVGGSLEVLGLLVGSHIQGLDGALTAWVLVLGVEALYSIGGLRRIRHEVVADDDPAAPDAAHAEPLPSPTDAR
jgi:O-antigen/teichoic acid export membrane protein